ncbi:MAG: hypothetical protein IJW53_01795 [Clostridia bacterium]|nr:hypothetical protein [Clostridia bacterium]
MKAVERKLNKAQITTIWLLIISVLLAAAWLTVSLVIKNLSSQGGSSSGNQAPTPLEGEATYLNQLVAYPTIEEGEITYIEIKNKTGDFGVSRYPDDNGSFLFHYYVDGQEGAIPYTPPIMGAEGDFEYESLYAVETGDGYGMIYHLTYLCSALGAPYFTERIPLPSDDTEEGAAKREALLREYGLTQSESTMVSFVYGERDKTTGSIIEDSEDAHLIVIGDKALSGNGYYFMVDGRDYVYYTGSEYFSYALAGFHEFIKGRLVAEGLDGESVYGPYLTTDFKEWKGTVFKAESDRVFTSDQDGYKNYENPSVTVNGSYYASVDKGLDFVPESGDFSGYETEEGINLSFDLEALKAHPEFTRIKNALVGKSVGSYAGDEIIITLLSELYNSDEKRIDFGENESVSYEYKISKIEAVITDNGEKTSGSVESSDTLLKVTYRYTVGGVSVKHDCHGVIDLGDIDPAEAEKLVGVNIGEDLGESAVTVTVNYTADNALSTTEKYVLTGVTSIFDEYGAIADTITNETFVNISYSHYVDGKEKTSGTSVIRLADIKDGDKLAPLKTFLLGKGKGSYNETVYNETFYYEVMREFVTYEISEIEYFVANEMIVSFRFVNASKRDPFYGDTLYENTLTGKNRLYGLNAGSCESAVKLLGGIGTDSNSAVGLSGTTVAIGLSLDNMEKYGLFAHKIYFEMPRGIFDASEGEEASDNDQLSDFDWISTLGFTLYISDPVYDADGSKIRYIGSDMYDVIAKVPSADFDFVEYDFIDFWARKNLLMMDITKLQGLKLEFNMQDLTGEYDFEVLFKDAYEGYVNGEYVVSETEFAGSSPIDQEIIKVKASDDAFDTAFKEMFGTEWGDLSTLHNHTMGDGKATYYPGSRDTLGAAYFNSVYETLQLTRYLDRLTDEEQAEGFTKTKVMSLYLEVEDKAYGYTYDFYRIDDRRIMVSFYRSDDDGNMVDQLGVVSDYYISTFAFKQLVNHYMYLLNGKEVDENINYD